MPALSIPPFFAHAHLPVLSAAEMRAWDERSIEQCGAPAAVLMEAAGRGLAAAVHALHPGGAVLVLCGSGNNGGDGWVAARTLAAWGREVSVHRVGSGTAEASLAHGWELALVDADGLELALARAAVVVDALLGTGSSGIPRPPYAAVIRALNAAGKPVVAADGPSGIDFTTGQAAGDAVQATATVTFGAPKRGLLLHPGRAHAGRLLCLEIGLAPVDRTGARLVTGAWARTALPAVPPDAHKGRMGRVVIVAGRAGMAGASLLAAHGALRAGAGMAVVVTDAANREIVQKDMPEALFEDRAVVEDEVFARADAIVAGPGMGTDDAALALLRRMIQTARAPLLLDADALTLLAAHSELVDIQQQPWLLTPHAGEAGRLLGIPTAEVTAAPFAAAERLAERYGCAVLLKGTPSLVADTSLRELGTRDVGMEVMTTWVSVGGHSGLATGGMGDTLAGAAGAILARGVSPSTAAALALWYCGRAAERAGQGRGLLPRDIAEHLPAALLEDGGDSPVLFPGILLDLPAAV